MTGPLTPEKQAYLLHIASYYPTSIEAEAISYLLGEVDRLNRENWAQSDLIQRLENDLSTLRASA